MESEDQQLKNLFERTNREYEFKSNEILIPRKQWYSMRSYGVYISMAASLAFLISGSILFPVSESIYEWSFHSFELYQEGVESCISVITEYK